MEEQMTQRTLSWHLVAAIGLVTSVGACAPPPAPHLASNPPTFIAGPGTVWYSVYFDNDSFAIPSGTQQSTVNDAALYLRQHPNSVATIIGKTDSVGSQDYNMHLSHQRADAVRDALVYGGHIPADHVETRWTGEIHHDHATATDAAAAGNRVVDIAIHD